MSKPSFQTNRSLSVNVLSVNVDDPGGWLFERLVGLLFYQYGGSNWSVGEEMLRCPHKARFHCSNCRGSFTGPLEDVFIAGRATERNFNRSSWVQAPGLAPKSSWVELEVYRNNQTIQLKKGLLPVDTEDTFQDLHGMRKDVDLPAPCLFSWSVFYALVFRFPEGFFFFTLIDVNTTKAYSVFLYKTLI